MARFLHCSALLFTLCLATTLMLLSGTVFKASALPTAQPRSPPPVDVSTTAHQNRQQPPLPHSPQSRPSSKNTTTALPTSPLILVPKPKTVWYPGSSHVVQWSRSNSQSPSLPDDTTVDIVLIDPHTARKVHTLRRYIPLGRGAARVTVPTTAPFQGPTATSWKLALEFFRGRASQSVHLISSEEAQVDISIVFHNAKSSLGRIQKPMTNVPARKNSLSERGDHDVNDSEQPPIQTKKTLSPRQRRQNRVEDLEMRSVVGFAPEEMRQEYPNVIQAIELDHSFGLRRKVYTQTPYTLGWRVPGRVAELVDYSQKLQSLRKAGLLTTTTTTAAKSATVKISNDPETAQVAQRDLIKSFSAMMVIELVKDQTMERVSTLARNIPAETRFLYLQIQDRVPHGFYRLRVRMAVVQAEDSKVVENPASLSSSQSMKTLADLESQNIVNGLPEGLDGDWDFPGLKGKLIDQYESITRRFWVSTGAI